ncbi:MAG: FAD-dependent oxidoreductase [Desulfobacteraceae bacterium]
MSIPPDGCPVDETAQRLYRRWKQAGGEPGEKSLLAFCARLVRSVTVGTAAPSVVTELKQCAGLLREVDEQAAGLIRDLLTVHGKILTDHVRTRECAFHVCFDKKRIPPCQRACPAHIDIPGFINLAGTGQWKESLETIIFDNPFPHVCGLVCPAPCEDACLRSCIDVPVTIGSMKACVARQAAQKNPYPEFVKEQPSGRKVAIIGAGPAGLTAGFYLSLMGHDVKVFDDQEKAGGMLRYGIPKYRLPEEVLDGEIAWIRKSGVKIEPETRIEHIPDLLESGFDAVFIATGAHVSKRIPMKGIDLPFVTGGIDFLKKVNQGGNPVLSGSVVVIGGGNVAADVAASALDHGADTVEMVCLESHREMPASPQEIDHVTSKGVKILNSWGPVEVRDNGEITFKCCKRVFDENGRFAPEFDAGRTRTVKCDHVLVAAGQDCDLSFVESSGIPTENGLVKTDPVTLETGIEGIFAGGDAAYGPNIAVRAVRSGKQAAHAIHRYLSGKTTAADVSEQTEKTGNELSCSQNLTMAPTEEESCAADAEKRRFSWDRPVKRASTEIISSSIKERRPAAAGTDKNNNAPPSAEDAEIQAVRCLRCDICIGCGMCELACSETGADFITFLETGEGRLVFDGFHPSKDTCTGCGACESVCPTGAVNIIKKEKVQTVFTGTVFAETLLVRCSVCEKEGIGEKYLKELEKRTGEPGSADPYVCPACRMRQSAGLLKTLVEPLV